MAVRIAANAAIRGSCCFFAALSRMYVGAGIPANCCDGLPSEIKPIEIDL